MSDTSTYPGQDGLTASNSDVNALQFHVHQQLGRARQMIPVKVVKVYGGGVAKPGTIDVVPVIHQVDGRGSPTPHTTVYGIPYTRLQAGAGAIINDPQVGDFGTLIVSDRDISSFKNSGKPSSPASKRRFSLSDGIYHGNVMGPAPQNYVFFKPGGGVTVADQFGNIIDTTSSGVTHQVCNGGLLTLGGNGKDGTYAKLQTVDGPSTNCQARTG